MGSQAYLGGDVGVKAGLGGPATDFEAHPTSIRTQKPPPKALAVGGALGEGLLDPYARRRGLRDRRTAKTGINPSCIHHQFGSCRDGGP